MADSLIATVISPELAARVTLEQMRWGSVPRCPHCAVEGRLYRCGDKQTLDLEDVWPGVWKCGACRRKSTVTSGTVLARTKIPLSTWVHAVEIYCLYPEGLSALDLLDHLQISRRTAYLMHNRMRMATLYPPLSSELRKASRPATTRALPAKSRTRSQRIRLWPLPFDTAMRALLAVRPYFS